jgi:hypothetical protein
LNWRNCPPKIDPLYLPTIQPTIVVSKWMRNEPRG